MIRILMFDEDSTLEAIQYQINELIKEQGTELLSIQTVSQSVKGLNNMDRIIYTLRFKE